MSVFDVYVGGRANPAFRGVDCEQLVGILRVEADHQGKGSRKGSGGLEFEALGLRVVERGASEGPTP